MKTTLKKARIVVERDALDLKAFDLEYGHTEDHRTLRDKARDACAKTSCKSILRSVGRELYSLVPIINTLKKYQWRKWILSDAMAGISVGMVHIPQGMGFALLAAVAPVYGLYATFWQVLFYMFLGNCRHLSIGTMAVISLMIGSVVERETELWKSQLGNTLPGNETSPYTTIPTFLPTTSGEVLVTSIQPISNLSGAAAFEGLTDEDRFRSSVANGVSLIVGLTMFVMGILKLGILTAFMPPSFISGFTTAASFHITTTQLRGLFNIEVMRYGGMFNLPKSVFEVLKALPKSNPADVICSVLCFAILLFIKEFINVKFKKKLKAPIPAEMIVVFLGTLLSYLAQFNARWGVRVVGFIPVGIPPPAMPNLEHADTYTIEAIVTGVTSFAISISMVEILTTKHKYVVDPNKELIAYGVSYGLSSFFHCFAGAAAPPRCIVMDDTGGKSQVASFFTVLLLLLVLLVIGPVFRHLPSSCLACIIIVALIPLYKQFSVLPKLWRLSKPDLLIWIVTFLVSVIVDVSVSLGVGIMFAIFISIVPSMFAKGYRLGTTDNADLLSPLDTHLKVTRRENIAVFRYENTLHYLTIKNFKEELFAATVDTRGGDDQFRRLAKLSTDIIEKQQKHAHDDHAHDNHVHDNQAHDNQAHDNQAHDNQAHDNQAHDNQAHDNQAHGNQAHDNQAHDNQANGNQAHDNQAHDNQANGDLPVVTPHRPHAVRRPSYFISEVVSFKLRAIILDCSPIGYIDLLGIETLKTLLVEFDRMNVKFTLADCNPNLIKKLSIAGLIGEENEGFLIFPTVQDGFALLSERFKPRRETLPIQRLSKTFIRKQSHAENELSNGGAGIRRESLYSKSGSKVSAENVKESLSSKRNSNASIHARRGSFFVQRGGQAWTDDRRNSLFEKGLSNGGASVKDSDSDTDSEIEIPIKRKSDSDIEVELRRSSHV